MKFSVVIPVFNQVKFIKQAVDSVLNQKDVDLECIVVDGGSNDGTVEILKNYKDKRLMWKSEKDTGLSNAVNKGLRQVTGDIITFLGSDDYYDLDALKKIEEFFKNNKKCLCVNADYRIVNPEGVEIQSLVVLYKRILRNLPWQRKLLGITNFIIQPSTFWRKKLMDKVGLIDENLKYCMDYDYWMRIVKFTKIFILNECIVSYRIHPNSNRGASFVKLFIEDNMVVKKYITNPIILFLHNLHNSMTVFIYKKI